MYQTATNKMTPHMTVVHQFFLFESEKIDSDQYTQPVRAQVCRNERDDTWVKNADGQITSYRYAHSDVQYSFVYGMAGEVVAIESSDGWCWRKVANEKGGWVVRNCFDRWEVVTLDCHLVCVDESGVRPVGENPAAMCLPMRP